MAEDIVVCSWGRHVTFTLSLSSQVYKWVPANLLARGWGIQLYISFCPSIYTKFYKSVNVRVNKGVVVDVVVIELASHSVGIQTFLVTSCYRNRDKLRQSGPLDTTQNYLFLNAILSWQLTTPFPWKRLWNSRLDNYTKIISARLRLFSFTVVITSVPNKLVIVQGEIVCLLNSLTSTTCLQYVQSK